MLKVTSITKVCGACPSTWEATLADGQEIYIRYRWGYLSVRYNPSVFDREQKEIWGAQVGDEYAGSMDLEELQALTKTLLEFPPDLKDGTKAFPDYPELEGLLGLLEELEAKRKALGQTL